VNANDYHSVFSALSRAIEILDRNRTPEPEFIAAYDTLKQSRAMLARVLNDPGRAATLDPRELAAA
jgi:hypothetical protein